MDKRSSIELKWKPSRTYELQNSSILVRRYNPPKDFIRSTYKLYQMITFVHVNSQIEITII